MIYVWLDDIREAPVGYIQTHSVNETIALIELLELKGYDSFTLDLDHDLGSFFNEGGDARNLIVWLISTERNTKLYKINLHTANPVGYEFMKQMVDRYWE